LHDLFGGHLLGRGAEGLCSGEDVEPEVAAAFGPFVVLLGQDGADEADERVPVGEDADHVGAAADLLCRARISWSGQRPWLIECC